uniref:Nucleolin-like n=1 Tax=Saccoglossus kowalevskii TaxID=10224 RepID=A0ABM0GRW2_SACKO|nr:PREDICTED: nucleolin-like [Saccoglossus kowalevskii]
MGEKENRTNSLNEWEDDEDSNDNGPRKENLPYDLTSDAFKAKTMQSFVKALTRDQQSSNICRQSDFKDDDDDNDDDIDDDDDEEDDDDGSDNDWFIKKL